MLHELVIDGTPTGKRRELDAPPDFNGHPTKSGWIWLPVAFENAMPGANQVLADPVVTVENGRLFDRRAVRAKTAAEKAAETRAARDPLDEIDALRAEVDELKRARQ